MNQAYRTITLDRHKGEVTIDAASVAATLHYLGYAHTYSLPADECELLDFGCEELCTMLGDYQDFHGLPRTQEMDPDTLREFLAPRCGKPDINDPEVAKAEAEFEAVGHGPFRRCHDVGDFHAVNVHWTNNPPSHLMRRYPREGRPDTWRVIDEVLERCVKANAVIGFLTHFTGAFLPNRERMRAPSMIATFVTQVTGWIGLAVVGGPQHQCTSTSLWSRYQPRFLNTSTNLEQIVRLWVRLILHEICHNEGSGHVTGGIMNPSITDGPASWIRDPREAWKRNMFGGQPVPLPDDDDDDDDDGDDKPPPDPDKSLWIRGPLTIMRGTGSDAKEVRNFLVKPHPTA